MPFKHNFDGHLGESLRKRSGTLMSRAVLASILLAGVTGAAFAAPARPARRLARALPDSVIARFPHRDLTARELNLAWNRLDPRFRPRGTGLARKKAFLDQLIEREVIARAALKEPFVMTDVESAQFLASQAQALRDALYKRIVIDSTLVLASDRDSALTRLTASVRGGVVPPQAIETYAHTLAEPRRALEVNARIRLLLEPAWDDSAAARLARGYGLLDPTKPDPSKPFSLKLNQRMPQLAPADTGLVLVRSTVGAMTAGEFARRFALLNPFETDFPVTQGAVKARSEQFLGQMWFGQEALRQGFDRDPAVLEKLATQREGVALDHYFVRHVEAKIDTSDAVLKPFFQRNRDRYAVQGHSLVANVVTPGRATADSVLAELKAGASWDSVCARHVPAGPTRDQCGSTSTLPDAYPDSALVQAVLKLKPGDLLAQPLAGESAGRYVVLRLVERVSYRPRTFEEVRTFVVREASAEQTERLLQAELTRLRRGMPVMRNERALGRVDLGPEPASAPAAAKR